MLQHTDEKKPTGSTNYPAGHTDGAIVPAASSASKPPSTLLLPLAVTACAAALALRDALNTAAFRIWCAAPSGWGRGTIRIKPKGPVLKNTFSEAVATLTAKQGFVTPNFWGLCACTALWFWSVVGAIRKDARTASDVFLTTTLHPMRSKTQTVALVTPEGAKTMTATTVASANTRTPITNALNFEAVKTPTTSEAQAFALLQATSDATMAKLYLSRGNIAGARRKAVQLLKALQALEVSQ